MSRPSLCDLDSVALVDAKPYSPCSQATLATALSLILTSIVCHVPIFISASSSESAFNEVTWATVHLEDSFSIYFGLREFEVQSNDGADGSYEFSDPKCKDLNNHPDFDRPQRMCDQCDKAGREVLGLVSASFVLLAPTMFFCFLRLCSKIRLTPESQIVPAALSFVAGIFDLIALCDYEKTCFDELPSHRANYGPSFYLCIVCLVAEWLACLLHMSVQPADEATLVEPKPEKEADTVDNTADTASKVEPKIVYAEEVVGHDPHSIEIYPRQITIHQPVTYHQPGVQTAGNGRIYQTYSSQEGYEPHPTTVRGRDPRFEYQNHAGVVMHRNEQFQETGLF